MALRGYFLALRCEFAQCRAVFVGEELDELRPVLRPFIEYAPCLRAAGITRVLLNEALKDYLVSTALVPEVACDLGLLLGFGEHGLDLHHREIAVFLERAVLV